MSLPATHTRPLAARDRARTHKHTAGAAERGVQRGAKRTVMLDCLLVSPSKVASHMASHSAPRDDSPILLAARAAAAGSVDGVCRTQAGTAARTPFYKMYKVKVD